MPREGTAGPHSGKGPRGYRRPDERIREEVCELLFQHPAIDASDIDVQVRNGVAVLEGTVDDRRTKHRVEDLACGVNGVQDVENRLRVSRSADDAVRRPPAPYHGRDARAEREGSLYGGAAPPFRLDVDVQPGKGVEGVHQGASGADMQTDAPSLTQQVGRHPAGDDQTGD